MPQPKWLTELDTLLDSDQKALLSTELRAALAKATVETTDDKTTSGITRVLAVAALTELTPVALTSNRAWVSTEVIALLTTAIQRWQRTRRTTPANTSLVQTLRTVAARYQTDLIGQALWASARLICWSHPVSYANPHNRQTVP